MDSDSFLAPSWSCGSQNFPSEQLEGSRTRTAGRDGLVRCWWMCGARSPNERGGVRGGLHCTRFKQKLVLRV